MVPLIADVSLWFTRRRGIAVAIVMSGNYLAGAVWPPLMRHFIDSAGWRATYLGTGAFCLLAMPLLALAFRRRPPAIAELTPGARRTSPDAERPLGFSRDALQALLCVAGVSCCVAMAMPQVHMVAYCGDLGYPAARGAEMLSLMLGFGIVMPAALGVDRRSHRGPRHPASGRDAAGERPRAVPAVQRPRRAVCGLRAFRPVPGSLVPSYPLIAREYFPAREAGVRTGTVLMATLGGMALGGWMPGWIFDATGSYRAAFVNGIAWSLVTTAIALLLASRAARPARAAGGVTAETQPGARDFSPRSVSSPPAPPSARASGSALPRPRNAAPAAASPRPVDRDTARDQPIGR